MSGKIIVHIGLPKTATTTLQIDFFPGFSSMNVHYIGVVQPRSTQQSNVYKKLTSAVLTGQYLKEARTELECLLKCGDTFILSEEGFSLSNNKTSWQDKFKYLSEILDGLDYSILITVREPTAAMFSYYVELRNQFIIGNIEFIDFAKNDEMMHIFHYKKLMDTVFKYYDQKRVFAKKFEEIIGGEFEDLVSLITGKIPQNLGMKINDHNKKNNDDKRVYLERKVSLGSYIRKKLSFFGFMESSIVVKSKFLLIPIMSFLNQVSFSVEDEILKPSQDDMDNLKEFLREETLALDKYFGINYE